MVNDLCHPKFPAVHFYDNPDRFLHFVECKCHNSLLAHFHKPNRSRDTLALRQSEEFLCTTLEVLLCLERIQTTYSTYGHLYLHRRNASCLCLEFSSP